MSGERAGASVRVAAVQFAPGADRAANLEQMERLAHGAVARGADVVVFPEYSHFFSPQLDASWVDAAEGLDGRFVDGVTAMAREFGVHVVAGMVERADAGHISNTLVAIDPAGDLVATHRKLHLYDAFGHRESDRIAPGDIVDPQTFAAGGFTVGMQTCYDIRFPEVSRRLVDAGADVLLVPSEWVPGPGKEHHWRTLLTARAIENTSYVVAADHAAPSGIGVSTVIDPAGVELASLGDGTDVVLADLSVDRLAEVREVNPALRLRRFRVVPA
ncbi:putative amidohydrolase [Diaminobutyricimonas aerilata]|uniref:Putative amidohydrolase n=1 Tax=Diaminobutyricimonas aerilata TaxID=1162967 RepID=A0A2M9CIF4_9MICO|nr:carbon-nitrogen hydrolase family protein [Diaminobutyricimonas aerilata]PJJ71642.1 putative amidohydrolase [Diaminobutyricimonas aerilata]